MHFLQVRFLFSQISLAKYENISVFGYTFVYDQKVRNKYLFLGIVDKLRKFCKFQKQKNLQILEQLIDSWDLEAMTSYNREMGFHGKCRHK